MKDIILNLLTTNTVIGIVIGAAVAWLVKWLAGDGARYKQYEGYAVTAIRIAEKAIADGTPNKGLAKLDYALQLFLSKYTAATGVRVDPALEARIESWIALVHNALVESGALKKETSK